MSEENLRNIGNQLIETGKQLLQEAAEKDKAALLSLASQDVLSEFSWTFDLEDLDVEDWSLEGQPVGQQAKAFVDSKAFIDSITSPKGLEEIREQLGEDSLHLATCPPRLWLNVYPAKKFIDWLKAHSHFQFTNSTEAVEALAPIIEERRIEHADLVELSSTLGAQQKAEDPENPVSVDAVDWDEVASGEQEAPPLLNFKGDASWRRTALETGEWIYVGPPTMRTKRSYVWSWDNSKESPGYTERGVPYEEAIARVDKECQDSDWQSYSALYRHLGEGIAELVYSKNKKDETEYPYPISLNAVDWDEEAPRLLNIKFPEPKN